MGTVITSCKKEKEGDTTTNTTAPPPTSNYYTFDNSTFTASNSNLGWDHWGSQFIFYCSNKTGGGGDKELKIQFLRTLPAPPLAGTYSVVADSGFITDSTTCSIQVNNTDTTFFPSIGGGVVVVGTSGGKTSYNFSNIPLSGGKIVSGSFLW